MYSSATSCQSDSPGSLFWMCHHSISTGSPESGASVPGASRRAGPSDAGAVGRRRSRRAPSTPSGRRMPAGAPSSSSSPPHEAATSATTPMSRRGAAGRGHDAWSNPPCDVLAVPARAWHSPAERCQSLSISLSTPIYATGYARRCAPAGRRVTIGDVAAEAGVSIATVSKVINDRYGVAPDTFSRVKAVIADLGYESSLVARSLRSRRTNVIGILVADIEPFSAELLKGAAAAIRASDFELIVYSGSGHGKEHSGWERRNVSRLSGTLTDGIILVTPTVDDVGDAGPIVAVDPHAGPSSMPSVHSDNLAGAITATRVPHRPRPPPHRVPRRAARPRVGPAAGARLPRRAGGGRHHARSRAHPRRRVRARGVRGAGPPAAHARRAADRDLRRQRPLGDPDDARRPVARARRCPATSR